jgi:hypothetical protein
MFNIFVQRRECVTTTLAPGPTSTVAPTTTQKPTTPEPTTTTAQNKTTTFVPTRKNMYQIYILFFVSGR